LAVTFSKLDASVCIHESAKLVVAPGQLIVLADIVISASVTFSLERIQDVAAAKIRSMSASVGVKVVYYVIKREGNINT